MTLAELHEIVTAIYRAGWDDAVERRKFDPKVPEYMKFHCLINSNTLDEDCRKSKQ